MLPGTGMMTGCRNTDLKRLLPNTGNTACLPADFVQARDTCVVATSGTFHHAYMIERKFRISTAWMKERGPEMAN
jgi:hypothetical protein